MTLHRRQVLTALGTTGVAALAGCPSRGGNESPTETAPPLSEPTTKIAPADGSADDLFGSSVAVAADGTTALVSAPEDDDPNGYEAGSAYVFERAGGSWTQQAKLAAADGDRRDLFGGSVAMAADGTTAIVGAYDDEDPIRPDSHGQMAGAAYVFDAAGGDWSQQAKLAPADGDAEDQFGESVAMATDGTTALLGAPHDEDPNGRYAGSAYVFERAGGSWTQQAKLAPADEEDQFGGSVAMAADGETAVVGDSNDENPNGKDAETGYVFERSGGSWRQQANLAAGNRFRAAVAVAADGTTALVGGDEDENPNGRLAGSAYVFERAGGSWTQQAKLAADDRDSRDFFGGSVAMAADGRTAIVGAEEDEDPNGEEAGSAYVFERSGGSWTQQAKLAPADGDRRDLFGASVAMAADGTTALVGAFYDEDPNGGDAGAAYVFERAGGSWHK